MSAYLTAGIAVVYLLVALDHYAHGRTGLAVAFTAYAVANVGLVMAERG